MTDLNTSITHLTCWHPVLLHGRSSQPAFCPATDRVGIHLQDLCDILELNPNTVRDWAKSFLAGKFKTELSKTQFRYSEDFKLRCVTMRQSGMSWSAIEREMGVAQATVRRWVRAAEAKKTGKGDLV